MILSLYLKTLFFSVLSVLRETRTRLLVPVFSYSVTIRTGRGRVASLTGIYIATSPTTTKSANSCVRLYYILSLPLPPTDVDPAFQHPSSFVEHPPKADLPMKKEREREKEPRQPEAVQIPATRYPPARDMQARRHMPGGRFGFKKVD